MDNDPANREGQQNGYFERGISQYPTIGDEVHLVSEADLKHIYGHIKKPYFVKIGHIAGAESIPALIDINKLLTRHSAIVGTTGSGKSTTVAGILNALSDSEKYPSSRIIVLDIHGEYANALEEKANVYKINANPEKENEKELYMPFWALSFDELVEVSFGPISGEKDKMVVLERILKGKEASLEKYPKKGVLKETLSVDTPIPFSLNKSWYDLYEETFGTYYCNPRTNPGKALDNLAYEKDGEGNDLKGDPLKGIPPKFRKPKNEKEDDEKIQYLPSIGLNISSQLISLGSKLRIPRFDFLFKPGEWTPELDGKTGKDLDELLKEWIGSKKPITIFDLSGIPSSILNTIIGVLMRILYDALFWTRNLSEGGRQRPLLIVMEEAHNYLNDNNSSASIVVQRIVKEGRKYGIGAMIVSQRPSEINSTILSQCGTLISLRLANATDRGHICSAVTDNLEGLTSMLPILKTGEAIILGEAVKLPMRTIIDAPPKNRRPDSQDPIVYEIYDEEYSKEVGGWGIPMNSNPDYDEFLQVWRAQNPNYITKKTETMERHSVNSSNIASIGYDEDNNVLEIEFIGGNIYHYYDVPVAEYDEFRRALSPGTYLASHIKGKYRYSKV